jgi:hypothetical protein
MAIFDLNDFNYRKVVKLAPDAFITVNGAFGSRIISNVDPGGTQDIDIQGGVLSINVNASINPPGSGKANIQIVAPEYTGIHSRSSNSSSGYWVTLPSGAKIPFFLPMMEIQIFMKGRFLYPSVKGSTALVPTYYRTFWGFITDITEDYSDGVSNLSLQCSDMLSWWKYQKIMISPNEFAAVTGGPSIAQFPTIFKNKNPWQIIAKLLYETQWMSSDGKSTYGFIQNKLSNIYLPPKVGNYNASVIGTLAVKMNEYWKNRFNFFGESMQVEMFGLTKKVAATGKVSDPQNTSIEASALDFLKADTLQGVEIAGLKYNVNVDPDIGLDYNLLARVQPFSDYDLFAAGGAQSLEMSKLEIAQKVCESTHMEFFVDTNGTVVFKPPFYNLDVTKGNMPYYVIESNEVINYSASFSSEHICNYLQVKAPQLQTMTNTIEIAGIHVDWESMQRFGLRFQDSWVSYGNDSNSLSLIAAAEMARINAEANTGHVSIPLRPEMRLGYPIYLAHKDVYYYVSGITHSFTFGSSATTELSLLAKRDRVYDTTGEFTDGLKAATSIPTWESDIDPNSVIPPINSTETKGRVMKGFVQKFSEFSAIPLELTSTRGYSADAEAQANAGKDSKRDTAKDDFLRSVGAKSGSKLNGVYKIVPAEFSRAANQIIQNSPDSPQPNATGEKSSIMSNQVLMITKDTVPYTDIRGYRHIGAFPYGANMILRDNGMFPSSESSVQAGIENTTNTLISDPNSTGLAPSTQPDPTSGPKPKPGNYPSSDDNANLLIGSIGPTVSPADCTRVYVDPKNIKNNNSNTGSVVNPASIFVGSEGK